MKFRDYETDALVVSAKNGHRMSNPVQSTRNNCVISRAICVDCGCHLVVSWNIPANFCEITGSAVEVMCESEPHKFVNTKVEGLR